MHVLVLAVRGSSLQTETTIAAGLALHQWRVATFALARMLFCWEREPKPFDMEVRLREHHILPLSTSCHSFLALTWGL